MVVDKGTFGVLEAACNWDYRCSSKMATRSALGTESGQRAAVVGLMGDE